MTEIIDFPALVQNNPLTRLTSDYGSIMIQKIRSKFTNEDQQLFVANYYCYLNYNQKTDFVIALDNTWKWLGYERISFCKTLLIKNFKENVDYKIEKAASADAEAGPKLSEEGKNLGGAGLNKEYITLTVNCFKKLCLKSRTEKADKIHDYYTGLEEILNETVAEQTQELQLKLQLKDKQIQLKDNQREYNLLKNFDKKPVLYVGFTEENVVKFGYSDKIRERLIDHKNDIGPHFTIEYLYESLYNREIERRIKRHPILSTKRIKKIYGKKPEPQTELILLDETFTIKDLDKIIIEIKKQVESGEYDTFQKEILELEKENGMLKLELEKLKKNEDIKFFEYKQEIENLKLELEKSKYDIKKNLDTINEIDAKVVDIQLNSMETLNLRLQEIKKAVCHNFLVDLIAKEIISNSGNIKLEIKLTVHEIYEKYAEFRKSNRYEDPIHSELAENSLITKVFNNIDGIKNTYKTIDGVQSRAKLFYVDKISEWICQNLQVPKRFRNIFREISKDVIFTDNYYEILNINVINRSFYNFVIHLLTNFISNKFEDESKDCILIKDTIITEEYLKYINTSQSKDKKLTMAKLYELLKEIPGISKRTKYQNKKRIFDGFILNVNTIIEWIEKNLELSSEIIFKTWKNKLM